MNFFFPLPLDEQFDIKRVEQQLSIQLPIHYKIFVSNYKLGDGNLKKDKFLNPINNWITPFYSLVFQPFETKRELYFYGFYNEEELISDWNIYGKNSREWENYKMIRIGDIGLGGGLFLGTENEMADKVYRIVWDWDEEYELVANNVFELARGLVIKEDFSNMNNYKYTDFVQNWIEDYWRVK